ncbi:MAG: hypothetical protein DRI98_13645 [Bacteroidetes bacterium]|nr:MAG: hypothetical protein DRI98_13645 [Bacteroidota bacterium]
MADTRGSIRDTIKEWSQRKNISDESINRFIELAMSRANRMLRIPPFEAYTTPTVSTNGYFDIPSDYIEAKEVSVEIQGNKVILERKSINEVDYKYTRSGGDPCIFGRIGNQFRIAPWGLEDTTVGMYYFNVLPAMVDDSQENWFTNYAPEILIYGGMAELAKYTRDDEGAARWGSQFVEAVNIIQGVEDRAEWRGSSIGISISGSY